MIASPGLFWPARNGFAIMLLALLACWIDGGDILPILVICAAASKNKPGSFFDPGEAFSH